MDLLQFDSLLTSEEKLLRDTVKRFVDQEVAPIMAEAYEAACFPIELIPKLAEMGLLDLNINPVAYGLICQELERGDSAIRSFVSVQRSLAMFAISQYGDTTQKNLFLPAMAAGQKIACFGLTEPDSGSDPSHMRTQAKKVSDGWILNGTKTWITNAPFADLAIVWAKTEEGIRGFIAERAFTGFTTREIKHKLSMRA